MGDVTTRTLDRFGEEIHVGDAVFSCLPYDFRKVEGFCPVNDRGETTVFVMLGDWLEPVPPSCVEIVGDGDFSDRRWDNRRAFCGFDAKTEWAAFQARFGERVA